MPFPHNIVSTFPRIEQWSFSSNVNSLFLMNNKTKEAHIPRNPLFCTLSSSLSCRFLRGCWNVQENVESMNQSWWCSWLLQHFSRLTVAPLTFSWLTPYSWYHCVCVCVCVKYVCTLFCFFTQKCSKGWTPSPSFPTAHDGAWLALCNV